MSSSSSSSSTVFPSVSWTGAMGSANSIAVPSNFVFSPLPEPSAPGLFTRITSSSLVAPFLLPFTLTSKAVSTTWNFVKTHKKKAIGVTVVSTSLAAWWAYRKFKPIYDQFRADLKMMEQLANQLNGGGGSKHALLLQRFEHSLQVGDLTIRNFSPQIRELLTQRFNIEDIRARMKKDGGAKTRTEEDYKLWDDFKTQGFSRTIALLYVYSFFHALLKLQLNIIARYVAADQNNNNNNNNNNANANSSGDNNSNNNTSNSSSSSTNSAEQPFNPFAPSTTIPATVAEEINKWFFGSVSSHFLDFAARELVDHVHQVIQQELMKWKLDAKCTFQNMIQSVTEIRRRLDYECLAFTFTKSQNSVKHMDTNSTPKPFLKFLISPASAELPPLSSLSNASDPFLVNAVQERRQNMLAELQTLLSSDAFEAVLIRSLDVSFSLLFSQWSQQTFKDKDEIPFANAMVGMTKLFTLLLPEMSPNPPSSVDSSSKSPLLHALSNVFALKQLCGIAYLPMDLLLEKYDPTSSAIPFSDNPLHPVSVIHTVAPPPPLPMGSGNLNAPPGLAALLGPLPLANPQAMDMQNMDMNAFMNGANNLSPNDMNALLQGLKDLKGLPAFDRM